MQFFKKTISLAAALIIFSMSFLNLPQVNALDVPLPLDIHMTIDTVEIDINDIPENRIVPVDVYLENCPGFLSMWTFFEKDSRLTFASARPFTVVEGVENVSSLNFLSNQDINPNLIGCGIPSGFYGKIDHAGALIKINVVLPENAQIGEFYSISFSRYFGDNSMSIDFTNELEDRCYESSFTQLNAGGILITGEIPTEPAPPQEPEEDYNHDENDEPVEDDSPEDTEEADEAKETTTSKTTTSTTSTTSTTTTTTVTTTVSKTTEKSTSTSSTTIELTTIVTIEENDNKNNSKNIGLIVLAIGVAAVGSVTAIIIKSKKK